MMIGLTSRSKCCTLGTCSKSYRLTGSGMVALLTPSPRLLTLADPRQDILQEDLLHNSVWRLIADAIATARAEPLASEGVAAKPLLACDFLNGEQV